MKNLPFDLDHIILIRTIIKYGSFKKASYYLGISQPTLSIKIKNLEKKLESKIFLRKRPIILTEIGIIFYQYSEQILFLCEEVCQSLNDFKLYKNNLVIGASQTIGTYLMPQMLGLFKKKYTNINITLEIHSSRKIAWYIAHGLIDFAIVGGDIPKELRNNLEIIPYAEDELALIISKNHPLANQSSIKKEDLYRLNFITLNKNSTIRKVIDKILNRNGIDTRRLVIDMELNTIEAIKNTVQYGSGAAFISLAAISQDLLNRNIHLLKIDNLSIKRTLSILINPNRYKTKAFYIFIKEISNLFSNLPIKKLEDFEETIKYVQ